MPRVPGCEAVYEVADQWRDRCLIGDTSLLWPDEVTWTPENLDLILRVFLDKLDAGPDSFVEKLRRQVGDQPEAIHRIAADALAIYCLFPSKTTFGKTAKTKLVHEISSWKVGDPPSLDRISEAFEFGIGSPGPHYLNSGRPWQFAYIISFGKQAHIGNPDLNSHRRLQELANEASKVIPGSTTAARNALLHLLLPACFERIVSSNHKRMIVAAFRQPDDPADVDDALFLIRDRLKTDFGREFDFYEPAIKEKWDPAQTPPPVPTRYWTIAHDSDVSIWKRFADENLIAVGWPGTPDLRTLDAHSVEELGERLKALPGISIHNDAIATVAKQLWSFFHEISKGDKVVAYGQGMIRGHGTIVGDYDFVESKDGYCHIRQVEWESTQARDLSLLPANLAKILQQNITLFELTKSEFETIVRNPSPDLEQLEAATYILSNELGEIESLLRTKKHFIFEGPPGSGKTYVARLFARYLAGLPLDAESDERIEIVQFHQSYGYEDFVAGIRPVTNEHGQLTYQSQPGIFVEMCERAASRPDETFVLIIDEINRGNLSRIFGELLYALEYRDHAVRLQTPVEVDGRTIHHLQIPANLYLIGTMNSTDRSLAMIDYALRRRFYFWRLMPTTGSDAPVLRQWLDQQVDLTPQHRSRLIDVFVALNANIAQTLGEDFQVGHSYLMLPGGTIGDPAALERVWRHAIEPLLREYFHTSPNASAIVDGLRAGFLQQPVEPEVFETSSDLEP